MTTLLIVLLSLLPQSSEPWKHPTGFGTAAERFRVPEKTDDHVRLAIATGF